jgi:hypothetical protein
VKIALRGRRFYNAKDARETVNAELNVVPPDTFSDCCGQLRNV